MLRVSPLPLGEGQGVRAVLYEEYVNLSKIARRSEVLDYTE
jgi:hypothetical protein